jgi:hypothetical protein
MSNLQKAVHITIFLLILFALFRPCIPHLLDFIIASDPTILFTRKFHFHSSGDGLSSQIREQDNYNWVVDNAAKLGKDAMLTAGVYGNQMQAKVEGWISGLSGGKAAPADDKAQVKERLLREIEARQKAEREAKWRLEAEAAAAAEAEAAAAEQAAASESQHEAEPAGVGAAEGASDDGGAQVGSIPACGDFDMFDCSATHEYSACLARKKECEADAA